MSEPWEARVGRVIGGVVRQAVEDAHAQGIVVLEPDTPEAKLLLAWSMPALGPARVWRVEGEPGGAEARHGTFRREELHRAVGRVLARERTALLAHPINKTALLLDGPAPPEPLLPLGDLYASRVADAMGAWTGSDALLALADAAGGIAALDDALSGFVEGRQSLQLACADLPEAVRTDILQRWERGVFWRRRLGLVPKLSVRTPGVDLFE
jgi:hypothetical protein